MFPSAANSDYPEFVADQVLTSENLNDLFNYLDEQGRMTRTNLIGIGIVCGLQVKTAADGSSITITKGVGVTSSGYLVSVPEITYTERTTNVFDAVEPIYYNKFVDTATKTQKFNLWELKQAGESQDTTLLNNVFLQDGNKIVLIFVELLEENNKNCDPDSCDDKGTKVTVNFRPLLAAQADVDAFLSNSSNAEVTGAAVSLPDKKMPRFDVGATLLLDTEDVFAAYQKILSQNFIDSVQATFSAAYTKLQSILSASFATDPFNPADTTQTLHSLFSFLYDGSITNVQAVNLQYYYDFFSDLLQAYDELKKRAFDSLCECAPDESLFPRHLLLGEAIGFDEKASAYRTRFISSPALCCCDNEGASVKDLFTRLVLMIANVAIPAHLDKKDTVKITPSSLGKEPISEKAIPYYYNVKEGAQPLYASWNPQKTKIGTANQLLSYQSFRYNGGVDDFVMNPLNYDLELYNFFRIEGHIGRDYIKMLTEIEAQQRDKRLPFEVVALSSDTRGIFSITNALTTMDTTGSVAAAFAEILKQPCCFADIFLALDEWINKVRCCLAEQMRYYIALPAFETKMAIVKDRKMTSRAFATGTNLEITDNTIGHSYQLMKEGGLLNNQFCTNVFVNIHTGAAKPGSALVLMPYRIDRVADILPDHITKLDAVELEARIADLIAVASQMRTLYSNADVAATMEGVDTVKLISRLELNCITCLLSEFRLLIKEFLIRLLGLMLKQKLGYYANTNPGIQHKAGVPVGGTFILVYHEQTLPKRIIDQPPVSGTVKPAFAGTVTTRAGDTTTSLFSGDQALLSSLLFSEQLSFLQQVAANKAIPNQVLDPIIENIAPGTIIADFYVPYLCCSDCAPSQAIVLTTPTDPPVDQPPVAKAAVIPTSMTMPANNIATVSLDASGSTDPANGVLIYAWSMPPGTTGATIVQSNAVVTDVNITQPNTYVFTLNVTNDKGLTAADTASVTVNSPVIVKTCLSLTEIMIQFKGLGGVAESPDFFKRFEVLYPDLKDITVLFQEMNDKHVDTMSTDQQIDFFISKKIDSLLGKWVTDLAKAFKDVEFRLLAITMLKILAQLIYYIACIQREDVDKAKLKMLAALKNLLKFIGSIKSLYVNSTDPQRAVWKELLALTQAEADRVKANGEAKPVYTDILNQIIEILKATIV